MAKTKVIISYRNDNNEESVFGLTYSPPVIAAPVSGEADKVWVKKGTGILICGGPIASRAGAQLFMAAYFGRGNNNAMWLEEKIQAGKFRIGLTGITAIKFVMGLRSAQVFGDSRGTTVGRVSMRVVERFGRLLS